MTPQIQALKINEIMIKMLQKKTYCAIPQKGYRRYVKKIAKIQFLSGIDEDGGGVGDEMKMIQKGYNEDLI